MNASTVSRREFINSAIQSGVVIGLSASGFSLLVAGCGKKPAFNSELTKLRAVPEIRILATRAKTAGIDGAMSRDAMLSLLEERARSVATWAELVSSDFRENRVVELEGWILSHSETLLAVLASE